MRKNKPLKERAMILIDQSRLLLFMPLVTFTKISITVWMVAKINKSRKKLYIFNKISKTKKSLAAAYAA